MTREEFIKNEIEKQKVKEKSKVFKKFRVVVYEQKKSGGYPFTDFETDNFYEAVSFAKKMIQEQKNYRKDSEYLWVEINEFQPIHKRSNVIYPYKSIVHFGENDIQTSKYEFGGDFQSGVYAGGGSLKGVKLNFELETEGDYDDSYADEVEKIKLLRKVVDFDEVKGFIDYSKGKDNTNLKFFKNGKLVMTLKGDYDTNSEILDTELDILGIKKQINYHPYDGMGGVDFDDLQKQLDEINFKKILTNAEWLQFIKNNKSYFNIEEESEDYVQLTTRENGNVGDEEYGIADIEEAKSIVKKLKEKYPKTKISIYTVDEFVYLELEAPKMYGENESFGNGGDFQAGVYAGGGGVGYNSSDPRIKELTNKPSLDSRTGLIYYFDIPFTTEDIEDILASSKSILNAKFTPNKQFNIQPMVFIKDKVNGGEHTFSVAQIGILASFHNKNKNKTASRKDFSYANGGNFQTGVYAGGGLIESKIDKLYMKSNFINDDYNWRLKLLEMLQDNSIEAYNIYQSLNKVQKEEVLQELYEMDNDMGSYGDEDIETSKENLSILLKDAKNGKKYDDGGEVKINTEIILTENRPNGAKWKGVVKPFMLQSIEKNQYMGGFKRYEIDIYDEVKREPTKEEVKKANEFFDKIGGRYENGGGVKNDEVTYFLNKDGIKVRSKVEPKRKLSEAEWMAKHNESKEARTYSFGGLFSKSPMMSRPKRIDLNQQQVRLKSGEYVQVLNQNGDTLMVMDLTKLGTGTPPKYVKLSDVDMTSLAKGGGVGLIGNQKSIDMNKNGKIDAEDFKLLRSSMNGAWRNERKHVNHNEDYEIRYARKKPSRTGYKGKRKFGEGGGISNFERLSRVVAKNYEGKRVKPQYQKEYGKVYSKSEAKEVGNKVAGKMKMMKKAESGSEVKKGNRGGVMLLAKKIRKEGESWKDALKRAGQQLK